MLANIDMVMLNSVLMKINSNIQITRKIKNSVSEKIFKAFSYWLSRESLYSYFLFCLTNLVKMKLEVKRIVINIYWPSTWTDRVCGYIYIGHFFLPIQYSILPQWYIYYTYYSQRARTRLLPKLKLVHVWN